MNTSLLQTETAPFSNRVGQVVANVSHTMGEVGSHLSAAAQLDPREAARRVASPDLIAMQMNPTARDEAIIGTRNTIAINDQLGERPTETNLLSYDQARASAKTLLRLLNMAASGKTWIMSDVERSRFLNLPTKTMNAVEQDVLVGKICDVFISSTTSTQAFVELCLNPITDPKTTSVDRIMYLDALGTFLDEFDSRVQPSEDKRIAIEFTLAEIAQQSETQTAFLAALPPTERQALQIKAVALLAQHNFLTHRPVIERFFSNPQQPLESKHVVLDQMQFHTLGSVHTAAELFQKLEAADYPAPLLKKLLSEIEKAFLSQASTNELKFIRHGIEVQIPQPNGEPVLSYVCPDRQIPASEMRNSIKQTLLTTPYRSRDLATEALTAMASTEQATDSSHSLSTLLRSRNSNFTTILSPIMLEVMAEQIPLWLKTDAAEQKQPRDGKPILSPEDLQKLMADLKQGLIELLQKAPDNTLSPQVIALVNLLDKLQSLPSKTNVQEIDQNLVKTDVPSDLLVTDVEDWDRRTVT